MSDIREAMTDKGAITRAIERAKKHAKQIELIGLVLDVGNDLDEILNAAAAFHLIAYDLQSLKDAVPDEPDFFDNAGNDEYNAECARLLTDAVKG